MSELKTLVQHKIATLEHCSKTKVVNKTKDIVAFLHSIEDMGEGGGELNPFIATSDDEMEAFLTSEFVGKFVKFTGTSTTYETNAFYQIGEQTLPSGTPFAVGDTLSKVYFDTSKTDAEMETLLASLLTSGDNEEYVFVIGGDNFIIAQRVDGGTMFIACADGESGPPKFIYTTDVIEGMVEQAGWQEGVLDSDGAFTFTTSEEVSAIDLDHDHETAGKADLWNGVIISSTEFGSGETTYVANRCWVAPIANLEAGNIKKDVEICGVTGTYEGQGGSTGPEFPMPTFNKVYFDTSMSTSAVSTLIRSILGSEQAVFAIKGISSDSVIYTLAIASLGENNEVGIYMGDSSVEGLTVIFASDPIEGMAENAGWQEDVLDSDGAVTLSKTYSVSALDINFELDPVGKASLWNGVLIGSTKLI